MSSLFDEIQQRAEKLNTDVRLGDISEFRIPTLSSITENRSGTSQSLLDTDLDDIFRRSEEIWNKKQCIRPVAGMSVSLRASKDWSQLNTTRLTGPQQQKQPEKPQESMEYDGVNKAMAEGQFADGEVDKYVKRAFERARIEAERTFLNQQILERPQQAGGVASMLFSPRRKQVSSADQTAQKKTTTSPLGKGMKQLLSLPNTPLLSHDQNVFAQKIDTLLNTDCNSSLTPAIKEAVKKLNTKEADYVWSKVFSMFPKASMVRTGEEIRVMRSEKRWLDHIIDSGTNYLQKEFENYMETTIEGNLARARRGGIPGTLSRVEAYLNVRQPTHPIYEDGLYGAHPKWTVLFHCLRSGDLAVASKVASEGLSNIVHCTAIVKILEQLPKLTDIDEERRIKMRAEWKQNAQNCQDVHKKAVYGLFLGFDCPEANQTIEDWLWARLFACKYAPEPGRALRQLQTTICQQHGEKYFVAEGGSHLLYFAVLLLTGQFERAIYVLFKSSSDDYRAHSIHIALLAYQLRLLLCTSKVSDEFLHSDVHEASVCYLNLARLVLLYVKDFEMTNVNYALNYCFFLRHFELDPQDIGGLDGAAAGADNRASRSVFEACVSRIVFINGERDAILGQLNQRGERVPGLIDKFSGALHISDVIGRVAYDTNVQGDPLGACHLYALANRHQDAIKLICCQLSQCIARSSESATQKAVECAEWLAKRYNAMQPNARQESAQFATLLLLLDLYTFFALAAEGKHQQAIEIFREKLHFIPIDPEDVQASVAQFHLVPEEARPLLPDICAQLMRSIVSLHQMVPTGSPATMMLKQFAKALILYTAMIPYRFPVSTNSLLLQLQSKII